MKYVVGVAVILSVLYIIGGSTLLIALGLIIVAIFILSLLNNKDNGLSKNPEKIKSGHVGPKAYERLLKRARMPVNDDSGETLFDAEITNEGTEFFFDCHPAMMKREFAVIDFETATKQKLSVVSLGITSFEKGKCVTREWLFKPYRTKVFEFTYLHGITPEMVQDKPYFHEVWNEIRPHLQGKLLICHNANFDIGLLTNLLDKKLSTDTEFRFSYLCTLEISRRFLKGQCGRFGLENLCGFYTLPYGKHNGAKDTISTLFLLNKLLYEKYWDEHQYDRLLKGKKFNPTKEKTISISLN